MKKQLSLLILVLIYPQLLIAAENFCDLGRPHSIDIWAEKEMDKTGGVTVNIRSVQGEAYKKWDDELNLVYKKIITKLKEEDREELRKAQRAWIAFRDAEIKWIWSEALYGAEPVGTLASVIVSDKGTKILKDRVCELQRYEKQIYDVSY